MEKNENKSKFVPNLFIQQNSLYGEVKEGDIAKKHLTNEIIKSFYNLNDFENSNSSNNSNNPNSKKRIIIPEEDDLGVQKTVFGGLIITTKTIGEDYCNEYNRNQQAHIKNKTYAHKSLCENRDEPIGLLFLTLYDFVGDLDYNSLDNRTLCASIQSNIQSAVERKLPWVIKYAKHVIKDYYSMSSNKLKIKLNFILDDGKYETTTDNLNEKTKGGLLLNGFLRELEYYTTEMEGPMDDYIGIICQVLAPNGMPCNKKWLQIDVGISFIGKRLHKESLTNACIRQAKTIRASVHQDVIRTSNMNNKLYYSSFPDGSGYEGYTIFIWEIFYEDQLKMENENPLDKHFCKCSERYDSIDEYRIFRFNNQ